METKTRKLLIQVLGKTGSNIDAEALAFMRKANAILAQENQTWEQLLSTPAQDNSFRVPPSQRHRASPSDFSNVSRRGRHEDENDINQMFSVVLVKHRGNQFFESIYGWWEEKGFLTDAQYEKLKSTFEEYRK
jgi:hypothetical protein